MSDWNAKIIEEFRTNEGRVGGRFEGRGLLLIHTVGRKSGVERVNPLAYHTDGDRYVIIGSKGGAPTNPDWYHNLLANPRVTVEVGTQTFEVDAVELTGEERDLMWKQIVESMPGFGDYQKNTERIIPLVVLTRVG